MKRRKIRFLLSILSVIVLQFVAVSLLAQETEKSKTIVYKFDIKKEIAPPVWHSTKLAFEEAMEKEADIMLLHLNTYGGMLESADSIRNKILESPIPVLVFIDHNAASAGALISIACDSIYMTRGATIGAATVVDQSGKPVPDKYQSYMRAMMRSTAEASGRDPDIAQAMVDPRIKIEGIIDSGSVLTFTATEALKFGFCEAIAESVPDVLNKAGVEEYELVEQTLKPLDKIIAFLVNPIVSGLLIMIIIGGIYFELQTPGIGFPIIAAVLAAVVYFAPLYLEGLADHWEIIIFIVGVILIAVEIFAIPGFGVAGITGIVLIITGLTLSMVGNIGFNFRPVNLESVVSSFFIVVTSIFLAIVLSYYLTKKLFTKNRLFGSLALDYVESSEEGYTSSDKSYKEMIGEAGIAHTDLRPSGKVLINNDVYDATALTGYIEKGDPIQVVKYETTQLFVLKVES
jgi:membrane-bound serine protease (ClpP class)